MARRQKLQWVKRELGASVHVITCLSSEKHRHAGPAAVLIDDNGKLQPAWERSGGAFLLHTAAASSIGQLHTLLAVRPSTDPDACVLSAEMLHRSFHTPPHDAPLLPATRFTVVGAADVQAQRELLHVLRESLDEGGSSCATKAAGNCVGDALEGFTSVQARPRLLVGLDVEWRPDDWDAVSGLAPQGGRRKRNAASLLQLALQYVSGGGHPMDEPHVYLVQLEAVGQRRKAGNTLKETMSFNYSKRLVFPWQCTGY